MIYGFTDDELTIDSVSYIEELSELLEHLDIERHEICLLGTAPLAVLEVVPNGDIDIVASGQTRQRIIEFAEGKPDSRVNNQGMAFLGDNVELLMEDRLCKGPYNFGITDAELINSEHLHFSVSGYKFARPEIILSMKGVKHREKDQRHVSEIENSGLFSTTDWDWERVHVTAPWRRNDPLSLFDQGRNSLRQDGPLKTIERMVGLAEYKLSEFKKNSDSVPAEIWRRRSDRLVLDPPLSKDVDICYPLPNLLSRQYSEDGNFIGYDIVERLLEIEGSQNEPSTDDVFEQPVTVSKTGRILSNSSTVASHLDKWSNELPKQAPEKTFTVDITDGAAPSSTTDISDRVRSRKNQLLIETGTAFHAIFWPAVRSQFDALEEELRSRFHVIDSREYLLENDFPAFVRSVYSRDDRSHKWFIKNKIRELDRQRPIIRVLSFEISDPYFVWDNGQYVSLKTLEAKLELRKVLEEACESYTYGTGVHMTDNFDNNAHLAALLSSLEVNQQ